MHPHEERFNRIFDACFNKASKTVDITKPEVNFARNAIDYSFQTSSWLGKLSHFLLPRSERIKVMHQTERQMRKDLEGHVMVWVDKKGRNSWVYVHSNATDETMQQEAERLLRKALSNQRLLGR